MKIITLTLSPAFDVHLNIPSFTAGHENLVEAYVRNIGGKGINISRALIQNGVKNVALAVIGEENGSDFLRGMDECGLSDRIVISGKGRIRENFTVHTDNAVETRISFKGFETDAFLLDRIYELTKPDNDTLVTFTGSVPQGITGDKVEAFLRRVKQSGARLVIDSKSVPIDMIKRVRPWLIKPNSDELSSYLGQLNFEGITHAAKKLHEEGIENVLVSLGADGAVLACSEGVYVACLPKIEAVSTIGAGDSMIAGFITAMNNDACEKLRAATAFGSAACLREGTNPPLKDDIMRIAKNVIIKRI